MIKKEEIQQEIEKTQKQLEALRKKLKEVEDEVPETLDFKFGDELFVAGVDGSINEFKYDGFDWDILMRKCHRLFKLKKYALKFTKRSQFIADLLHFKYLYDIDYEPDWNNYRERKWFVYYDCNIHKYYQDYRCTVCDTANICFSTEEIAQKCADWLNKKLIED